jgi:TonB family protein
VKLVLPSHHESMRRFALLSVTVHAVVVLALATLGTGRIQVPAFAAPELSIALSATAGEKSFVTRKSTASTSTRKPETPSGSTQEQANRDNDASPSTAAGESIKENHLIAAVNLALNKYFLYPALARRYGWEGKVSVRIKFEPDGHLIPLSVVSSSGYALLDRDAMNTLGKIGVLPEARQVMISQAYETNFAIVYRLNDPRSQ